MGERNFGNTVVRDYVVHADDIDKGVLPLPTSVLVFEFFGDQPAVTHFFGLPSQSRAESISMFGDALIAIGVAIQVAAADEAH